VWVAGHERTLRACGDFYVFLDGLSKGFVQAGQRPGKDRAKHGRGTWVGKISF
jgi:hypothetical protein